MHRALTPAALFAISLLSVSCAPPSATRPRPLYAESCLPARAVLVVRNETGYDADIMQHERRSGTSRLLAVVRTGRHELNIPNDGAYSYTARQGGATVSDPPLPVRREVKLEIECRNG